MAATNTNADPHARLARFMELNAPGLIDTWQRCTEVLTETERTQRGVLLLRVTPDMFDNPSTNVQVEFCTQATVHATLLNSESGIAPADSTNEQVRLAQMLIATYDPTTHVLLCGVMVDTGTIDCQMLAIPSSA